MMFSEYSIKTPLKRVFEIEVGEFVENMGAAVANLVIILLIPFICVLQIYIKLKKQKTA